MFVFSVGGRSSLEVVLGEEVAVVCRNVSGFGFSPVVSPMDALRHAVNGLPLCDVPMEVNTRC